MLGTDAASSASWTPDIKADECMWKASKRHMIDASESAMEVCCTHKSFHAANINALKPNKKGVWTAQLLGTIYSVVILIVLYFECHLFFLWMNMIEILDSYFQLFGCSKIGMGCLLNFYSN